MIANGTQVSGKFPVDGMSPNQVIYRINATTITSYMVYDRNGRAIKRVDITGKAHAGIPTPHVVEYDHNQSPTGNIFVKSENVVRPARLEEIP